VRIQITVITHRKLKSESCWSQFVERAGDNSMGIVKILLNIHLKQLSDD